jgi:hypothetical protein
MKTMKFNDEIHKKKCLFDLKSRLKVFYILKNCSINEAVSQIKTTKI